MAQSYIGLRKIYASLPAAQKRYFSKLENLLANGSQMDVSLAYLAMKIEEDHHRALKCGLVRIHNCSVTKVDEALEKQHFTREYFRQVFKHVFGAQLKKSTIEQFQKTENTRDRLIHGKGVEVAEIRDGIAGALKYAIEVGNFVSDKTDKNPFGDLRGLSGRRAPLDETTSYWLLKGLGLFSSSKNA